MPSVLGKRQRAVDTHNSQSTRSKRISIAAPICITNDENEDPQAQSTAQVVIGTPKRPLATIKERTPTSSVSKKTPRSSINAHFITSKPTPSPLTKKTSSNDCVDSLYLKTPRHRDAAAKVVISPNSRTSTPRHLRTPKTPKTTAVDLDQAALTNNSVYTRARKTFLERSETATLVGRADEKTRLSTFVSSCLNTKVGGCLYISGPPGTGKSAFVSLVLEDLRLQIPYSSATVNCMSIRSIKELVQRLADDLEWSTHDQDLTSIDHLKSHFTHHKRKSTPHVVVLDEIDRLVDLDLKVLYCIFEWAMQPDSKIILIGIANALDLTDRLLPRLKSRDIKPDLLPFMPYTDTQINDILTSKLKSLISSTNTENIDTNNYVPIIHPAAISLCSKKVAAHTGDLRKAFDICARAVDLIEQETRAKHSKLGLAETSPSKPTPLKENPNLSSPRTATPRQLRLSSDLSHLTLESAPRATIAHMARITSSIFSNGTTQRLTTLNMQQKAVLYALAGLEEQRRTLAEAHRFSTPSKKLNTTNTNSSAPTVKQLYTVYSTLCKREDSPLHPLSSIEFRDVLGGLETLSLVSAVVEKVAATPMTPSRTPSRRRKTTGSTTASGSSFLLSRSIGSGNSGLVSAADEKKWSCSVGRQELMNSLQGPGSDLLKNMLEGVDLLGSS